MGFSQESHNSVEATSANEWADLLPEVLSDIFRRLPFEDRLSAVPVVCKSWNKASYNPVCWTVVDMGPWLDKKTKEDSWWAWEFNLGTRYKVCHLIKVVAGRSCGQIRQLRTLPLSGTAVGYISERCPRITVTFTQNVDQLSRTIV